jgi:hypothetical protein
MSIRTDTNAPKTTEPAMGLRVQNASDLFSELAALPTLVLVRPTDGMHCLDFLRQLKLSKTPEEAITFMAFALAPRHAVWWGHECLKAAPDFLTDQDRQMMAFIASWVAEQDDDSRYAAMEAAMQVSVHGPGVWMALGAGWSGGSMSARGLPPVAPPPSAMCQAMNAGLHSALARVPQDKRRRMLDHFVGMAEVLAKSA